jgi:hypothetical protein
MSLIILAAIAALTPQNPPRVPDTYLARVSITGTSNPRIICFTQTLAIPTRLPDLQRDQRIKLVFAPKKSQRIPDNEASQLLAYLKGPLGIVSCHFRDGVWWCRFPLTTTRQRSAVSLTAFILRRPDESLLEEYPLALYFTR